MTDWIIAGATFFIAINAGLSLWLAFIIKTKNKEHQEQISDLFQAIAITNVLSGLGMASDLTTIKGMIKEFKEHYKGKTKIFD
jgi:hypothetical protein